MPPSDRDKLNRVEELKSKLFSKNYRATLEHRDSFLHKRHADVPDSWETGETSGPEAMDRSAGFFTKTSRFKKFFIFSILFLLLTLGYAAYVFFAGNNTVSNGNIDIAITGNTFTAGGEELQLVVGITNRNSVSLDLVDLVVEYPKGGGVSADTERMRQSLGSIAAGSVRSENVRLVLFGQQGSMLPVKISIEYRVEGSNAIFVKEKTHNVSISSTPVNLSVDAPLTASPNQNVVLNVRSTLNATRPASGVLLKVDYPLGFQFVSAEPKPSVGNNVWNMGDLAPGVEREIAISGKMLDVSDGEEKVFHVSAGAESRTDNSMIGVLFNTFDHIITVQKPFIEASLSIGGVSKTEYTADSKNLITGEISWRNNLDTKINDVEIRAKISGNAFNTKNATAEQGLYNSLENTLVWDKFSRNGFAEVGPGDSGSVKFSITPLPLFSATGGILSDPTIAIEVSISGKQLTGGYQGEVLNGSDSKTIRITSDISLAARALYYSGPFKNTGAIPPVAEKETTYTITWSIANTSNNVSRAEVQAVLPPWARFIGPVSPPGEDVAYNSSTRTVTWNAGRLLKGTGITQAPRSVSFQIGFTPLISQVKTVPILINNAILTGHDDFANVDLRATQPPLITELRADTLFPPSGGLVSAP